MNSFFSFLCKYTLAPFIGLLFIKELKGGENIPSGNFILASNHQSYLDIALCGYVCVPRKFTFIGQVDRKESWNFLRSVLYAIGEVIPVNRKDKDSRSEASSKAIEMIKRGYCLNIYPEGTRSKTGEVQEGRWGAAKLFLETGVPVVPMGIRGAFEIFPPGKGLRIKKAVKISIGKPMVFEKEFEKAKSASSGEYDALCASVTEKLMEEIKKLANE